MEEICFDVKKLDEMKRPQLQKLCKKLGIKANSKTSQLIDALKAHAKTSSIKTLESNDTSCLKVQCENVNTASNSIEDENESPNARTCNESEGLSYKEQLMQHLENKVEETLKDSKIPRLMNRNVTFSVGSKTPVQTKTKEHPAFKKMDSIDVYLEKKRKRTQSLYANLKKAKDVAKNARSVIADMKASHNTPAKGSPAKRIRRSTFEINKDERVKVPTSFSFGHLKSPKVVVKPSAVREKPKAVASDLRKSMSSLSKAQENKTPFNSRKSMAVTSFRSTGTVSSVSAKKKFDLQASLSKPLSYKPHRGKIVKFPFVGKDSKIPVLVNKKPLVDHKVDVKNVKVTSRVERRQNNQRSRADKRHNAVLARRGLAK